MTSVTCSIESLDGGLSSLSRVLVAIHVLCLEASDSLAERAYKTACSSADRLCHQKLSRWGEHEMSFQDSSQLSVPTREVIELSTSDRSPIWPVKT